MRMRSNRDTDDLITHPLKKMVLTEYGSALAGQLANEVVDGTFKPERAYLCTVKKRSGGYRDLVFPSLVDSIVARHAIDIIEPHITKDDNNRAFCGRSHANTNREIGNYDAWFQVWRDYTSSIARACEEKGYAYVFETDVSDFFPSIDRGRARTELEKRTGASSSITGFLFHCLEAWLVHRSYEKSSGLPIEPNDISRLIAHNYLKVVDAKFPTKINQEYLRYVDDTVVFVKDKDQAEDVKRDHYEALVGLELTPNAAKTDIVPIGQYERERYVEINREISDMKLTFIESEFSNLVKRWYRKRKTARNWSRVTKRLYTIAGENHSEYMRRRAVDDLQENPDLVDHVLRYMQRFQIKKSELTNLLKLWKTRDLTSEQMIGLARFLGDASFLFSDASKIIADFAVNEIRRHDARQGVWYVRALLLLVLFKHGDRKQRDKIFKWGKSKQFTDSQFRHYFLYVFTATGDVDENILNAMRLVTDSDLELTLRICHDANSGSLKEHRKLLNSCISRKEKRAVIEAKYFPFLSIILSEDTWRDENEKWIQQQMEPPRNRPSIIDPVVFQILNRYLQAITA